MIAMELCVEALDKIKAQPINKIGLVCQPPHFVYENNLAGLSTRYDYIREPIDVRNALVELLKTRYANLIIKDIPWVQELVMDWPNSVIKLHVESCNIEMYDKVNQWHSAYVLQKLASVEVFNERPTLYDLPVLDVNYKEYFNDVIYFMCTDETAYELSEDFLEHVAEEGIPLELELELTKAQRKHYNWITNETKT